MYNFEHLKNLVVKETTTVKKQRTKLERNPQGMTLRIFANGEVYPSEALVNEFHLEYLPNVEGSFKGVGLDIIDSLEWGPVAEQPRMILLSPVNKVQPKVDLFGTTRFNDDLTPKASVLTQGSKSETLLNLVRSMGYMKDNMRFVDLTVMLAYPIKTDDGIAYIPKTVDKGTEAGKKTYARRENALFYPAVVLTQPEESAEEAIAAEQETVTSN